MDEPTFMGIKVSVNLYNLIGIYIGNAHLGSIPYLYHCNIPFLLGSAV